MENFRKPSSEDLARVRGVYKDRLLSFQVKVGIYLVIAILFLSIPTPLIIIFGLNLWPMFIVSALGILGMANEFSHVKRVRAYNSGDFDILSSRIDKVRFHMVRSHNKWFYAPKYVIQAFELYGVCDFWLIKLRDDHIEPIYKARSEIVLETLHHD